MATTKKIAAKKSLKSTAKKTAKKPGRPKTSGKVQSAQKV